MTKENDENSIRDKNINDLDNICDECKKKDESDSQNII